MRSQLAGKLADAFLDSKLTPLLMAGALALGLFTVFTMPSEEEPQIIVPLADIYMPLPGASPQEVENRLLIPVENILSGGGPRHGGEPRPPLHHAAQVRRPNAARLQHAAHQDGHHR
jgi:hypothetical protein